MLPHRVFLMLCAAGFVCFVSYNQVRMPALSLFAEGLGVGIPAIGVIVSMSTLTGVFLKWPAGLWSDMHGRRVLLLIGAAAFALPPFVYPLVGDAQALAALRAVHGLATACFAPAALALVADLHVTRRGEAMGWYTASTQAGGWLGPLLGGWLVYTAGFTVTFTTAGLVGLAGAALVVSLTRQVAPAAPSPTSRPATLRAWLATMGEMGADRRILLTSLADASKMLARGALMAFLPLYAVSVGLHPGQVGLLFGAQGLTSLVAKPAVGRLSDAVGRRPMVLLGLLTAAAAVAAIPQAADLGWLLGLAGLFGLGEAVVTSCSTALVADCASDGRRGAGLGLLGTISDLGHVCGPLLAAALIVQLQYAAAFGIIAGLLVGAALGFLLGVTDERPSQPPQPRPGVL